MRRPLLSFSVVLLGAAVSACSDDPGLPTGPSAPSRISMMFEIQSGPRTISRPAPGTDEYIVSLRPEFDHEVLAGPLAAAMHGQVGYIYKNFNDFTIHTISQELVDSLSKRPEVLRIEKSRSLEMASTQTLPSDDALWHLDQIDQLGGARNFLFNYFFPGNGVHIYMLDTGIDTSSGEFAGRVGNGVAYTTPVGEQPYQPLHPHGTMNAGLAAGATYGVAKAAIIHDVRIAFTYVPQTLDFHSGVDWILTNVANNPGQRAVVNSSFRTNSTTLQNDYARLIANGISVVKAAGNSAADACADDISNYVQDLIVVGATDKTNTRHWSSNWGSCVTLFAPGMENKTVTLPNFSNLCTGTSCAAPLVAGTVAGIVEDLWATEGQAYPGRVYNLVYYSALVDSVKDPMGSPNRRLNSMHTYISPIGPVGIITVESRYYTWSLHTHGGNGVWGNYVWEASVNGGPYSVVSTSATYTRYVTAGSSYTLRLRPRATSFGQTASTTQVVTVTKPGACPPYC